MHPEPSGPGRADNHPSKSPPGHRREQHVLIGSGDLKSSGQEGPDQLSVNLITLREAIVDLEPRHSKRMLFS